MSDFAIKVENIGKKYILNRSNISYKVDTLYDLITKFFKNSFYSNFNEKFEEFWALRNINFEVKHGEKIGIIGRNGAGKSTLLKILSRIIQPTEGEAFINGRTASLLEVGTGFHPELTGRENIYLNGAILGMSRSEIKKKFDEIVEFAEVEKFLETPVKYYSSGMYVRLAFSVAAHLEPEILIVDEVLAVGDAAFQKKCLTRMENIGKNGTTILFVSHNMAIIQSLCSKCVYLNYGHLELFDKTNVVIKKYIENFTNFDYINLSKRIDRKGDKKIFFTEFYLEDENNNKVKSLICGKKGYLVFKFINTTNGKLQNILFNLGIDNLYGNRIALISNEICNDIIDEINYNNGIIKIEINKIPFMPGRYYFTIYTIVNGVLSDWIQNAGFFDVEYGNYYKSAKLPPAGQSDVLFDYKLYIEKF